MCFFDPIGSNQVVMSNAVILVMTLFGRWQNDLCYDVHLTCLAIHTHALIWNADSALFANKSVAHPQPVEIITSNGINRRCADDRVGGKR